MEEVKLHGFWASPLVHRVIWALKPKEFLYLFMVKMMRLRIKLSQAHGMRYIQILFKFLSDLLQELEQRNLKKRLMD
ncbi:hypothetical protein CUMW_145920 [Citrus unshiu]|nr:hypothetical protein CUMW_145920 [Citrus unshiu]